MKRLLSFILVLIIAPIIAGIYGIINDQITYTISPEYYTKFKFIQFNLIGNWSLGENIGTINSPEIKLENPRIGASIVGFLATWWVGLIIALVLGVLGLFYKDYKLMLKIILKSFLMVTLVSFIIGISGLLYGKMFLINNRPNWYFPDNLMDFDNFIMVGSMHNFSYMGGIIALIIGVIYNVYKLSNQIR